MTKKREEDSQGKRDLAELELSFQIGKKERLSTMPLAALLPQIGDIHSLGTFAPFLNERMTELQRRKEKGENEESEEQSRVTSEELMLNQVIQWLSLGEEHE